MKKIRKIKFNKAFTLVEMLVATAIFTTVMVVAIGALVSIVNADDRAQSIKTTIDNVNFAIDTMTRNLRSGTNYQCYYNNTVGDCSSGATQEISYDSDGNTTYYKFVQSTDPNLSAGQGNVQEEICLNSNCTNNWQSITAPTSTVDISSMDFYVFGDGVTIQPRVFITASGLIPSQNGTSTEFDIQTTASERQRS